RDLKTAQKLRNRLKGLGVTYNKIAMDNWDSFVTAFSMDKILTGKAHTVGTEGDNCRLRNLARRAFRRTCCFSKKPFNHMQAFDTAFPYINYGFV
ncbi:MAG: IS1 family transposase, partial [Spirochaetaceae bacterium]|nr:IS1 family transposase [Spirochaetaceae bacterium]